MVLSNFGYMNYGKLAVGGFDRTVDDCATVRAYRAGLWDNSPLPWQSMTAPTPYIHFQGNAREALTFYGEVFGCSVQLHTFAEFNRSDGPSDAIAHGYLVGPVELFGSDVSGDERPVRVEGMMLSLLGTAAPSVLTQWFSKLSEGGEVVDFLQVRSWGASDGQVVDRYGLHWLIGFEKDTNG